MKLYKTILAFLLLFSIYVGQGRRVKQQRYRSIPHKLKLVRKEIKYMFKSQGFL